MYNSTIYYYLKRSIYRGGRSINIITENIRLGFHANSPCPFSSTLGFGFISCSQLDIIKCVHGIRYSSNLKITNFFNIMSFDRLCSCPKLIRKIRIYLGTTFNCRPSSCIFNKYLIINLCQLTSTLFYLRKCTKFTYMYVNLTTVHS